MLLRVPVCAVSKVYAHCGPAYRRIFLMYSLNNKKKKKCAIDFTPGFNWSMAVYFSCFKIAMCQQCTWTHLVFRPACAWAHKLVQMHLLFKQCGAGRTNYNCVGIKLAKNTCVAPGAALRRVYDRAPSDIYQIIINHICRKYFFLWICTLTCIQGVRKMLFVTWRLKHSIEERLFTGKNHCRFL